MRKWLLFRRLSASILPCYEIPDQVGDHGLFVMPGFDRASFLPQCIGRVGTHEGEGLPEGSQDELTDVGQFFITLHYHRLTSGLAPAKDSSMSTSMPDSQYWIMPFSSTRIMVGVPLTLYFNLSSDIPPSMSLTGFR